LGIILWTCIGAQAQITPKYTELRVFNPYPHVSIKVMIKCDHNYKTNKYDFYQVVVMKRSSSITIKAPVTLKKCEIWPVDMKMFGDLK
jgi:hypothetical protein